MAAPFNVTDRFQQRPRRPHYSPHIARLLLSHTETYGDGFASAWDALINSLQSRHSREAYERYLHQLLTHLQASEQSLRDITPADVEAFLRTIDATAPIRKITWGAIRKLCELLTTTCVLDRNPIVVANPRYVRRPQPRPPALTAAQLRHLLDSIIPNTPNGTRDRAIIALIVSTRTTPGSIARLTFDDYGIRDGERVIVFRKQRARPVAYRVVPEVQRLLDAYVAVAAPRAGEPMFRSWSKNGIAIGPLTGMAINLMLRRRQRAARIRAKLTTESYRIAELPARWRAGPPLELPKPRVGR